MADQIVTYFTAQVIWEDAVGDAGLREGWYFPSGPEASIDRSELVEAIKEELGPDYCEVDERYRYTNWGAEASVLEIVVKVAEAAGSLGGLVLLIEKAIGRMYKESGSEPPPLNAETAGTYARTAVASLIGEPLERLKVSELAKVDDSYHVSLALETDINVTYAVEVSQTGVSHVSQTGVSHVPREESPKRGFFWRILRRQR